HLRSLHSFPTRRSSDLFGTPFDNAIAYRHDWQIMNLIGDDAHTFLQGQLTCDMAEATVSTACLGAHLSLQGRALVTLWVLPHPHEEKGFRLLLPTTQVQALQTLWEKYQIGRASCRERVKNQMGEGAGREKG